MSIENLENGVRLGGPDYNNNVNHATDVNRYLGGYDRTVDSHPYVKGYFYVFFGFPSRIFGTDSGTTSETVTRTQALNYTLSAADRTYLSFWMNIENHRYRQSSVSYHPHSGQ